MNNELSEEQRSTAARIDHDDDTLLELTVDQLRYVAGGAVDMFIKL